MRKVINKKSILNSIKLMPIKTEFSNFSKNEKNNYLKWLFLCRVFPYSTLTPTKEIDTVWHSHLQNIESYEEYCFQYLGAQINHDDRSNSDQVFKSQFQCTKLLWKMTFDEDLKGSMAYCSD